jgi:phosphoglycerate dehydrogenase-like enzyme
MNTSIDPGYKLASPAKPRYAWLDLHHDNDEQVPVTQSADTDPLAGSNAAPGRMPPATTRRKRRAVVNLRDTRPAWEIPGWARDAIADAFPLDWDVVFIESIVDAAAGQGDGGGVTDEALSAARGAEVYLGFGAPREILLAATSGPDAGLKWMHTGTAGVASLLYPEMVASPVVLTNSAAVHAPAMAETVLAMMLHFARGFDFAVRSQAAACWDPEPWATRPGLITEIDSTTLGILGLGGIGLETARRARALGMKVMATRRSGRPAPAGIELLTGPDSLHALLTVSDYLLIAVPSTAATRGLIGAREIAALKPGAVVINVARGDVIDEDALVQALRSGALRGAGLDVFRVEPLPQASPLWSLPNVLITPHVSATTTRFWVREVELIRDNIARYLAGRALRNVVDKQKGY